MAESVLIYFCPIQNTDAFLGETDNLFDSTHNGDNQDDLLGATATNDDPFTQSIDMGELLEDNSVMFPILDNNNEGDVNDLFGELELLLSVSVPHCCIFPLIGP